MLSSIFIDRPRLSIVISLVITIAGAAGASPGSTTMPGRTFCSPSVITRSPAWSPLVTT